MYLRRLISTKSHVRQTNGRHEEKYYELPPFTGARSRPGRAPRGRSPWAASTARRAGVRRVARAAARAVDAVHGAVDASTQGLLQGRKITSISNYIYLGRHKMNFIERDTILSFARERIFGKLYGTARAGRCLLGPWTIRLTSRRYSTYCLLYLIHYYVS